MNRFERTNKQMAWLMVVLMAAVMTGCGGGGSTAVPPPGSAGAPVGTGPGAALAAGTTTTGGTCTGVSCVNAALGGLGAAANYVILTKTGVSTTPISTVTGNIGLSPAAESYLTGWSQTNDSTSTYATSAQVVAPGKLYAADMVGGTTSSDLSTAVLNMQAAYTAAAGMAPAGGGLLTACPGVGVMSDATDAGFPTTGLPAGVYTCAVNVNIPGTLTLHGSATDVWVFQVTGKLDEASAQQVLLTGGALPKNVFWQVSGAVTIGTTALMQGVVLAQTNIAVQTGAIVNGRLLAQTAVTLDSATVTVP